MIDLHCHLLPDFALDVAHSLPPSMDDSARLQAALQACRLAGEQGITHIVATPHIYPEGNLQEAAGIVAAAAKLQQRLREEAIDLQVFPGAEVAFSEELANGVAQTPGLALAGKNYLLIEPPPLCVPLVVGEILRRLVDQGIRPILGHPERVMEFQQNPARLEEMVQAGALLQITATHLVGWGGRKLRKYCERLVKEGLAHFVASDAHFGDRRLLAMKPARQRLIRIAGEPTARRLLEENPLAVLEGRPIAGGGGQGSGVRSERR